MSLMEYLVALRRSWALVALCGLLGGALGFAFAETRTPVYQASSTVLITTEVGGNASELLQGSTYAENLVASYVRLATSERVLAPVVDELELSESPRALARAVVAESPLNTLLIDLSVSDPDPERAAYIADAITVSLADAVGEVSPRVDDEASIRVTVVDSATPASFPVSPNKRLLALLGLAVGVAIGVVVALGRHLWGSAITSSADVARAADVPVLGELVEARRDQRLSAAVLDRPLGPEAESLRALMANLSFVTVGGSRPRSFAVTSGSPAEAKSSVASALALVLAEASHTVLLIDADLRAPTLHFITNLDNTMGLSSVLIGDTTLDVAVQPWGMSGLDVLTSGPQPPNPGHLLRTEEMGVLVAKAEGTYDFVVIDTPPVLSVVDAVWVAHLVSGTLLVARRGRTKPRALRRTLDTLTAANVEVAGIVLSRMPRSARRGYGYGDLEQPSHRRASRTRLGGGSRTDSPSDEA